MRARRLNRMALFLLPSAVLFTLFFFLPIGMMAMMSVLTGNPVVAPNVTFTVRNYARIVEDPFHFEVIWTTIRIGLWTTFVALLIGYPLAHLMARVRSRTAHALLLMAVLMPMLTGIIVRTFAWMALLADKGVINQMLAAMGLPTAQLMYNEFGIVIGLVHIYVPFMVLTLTGVIGAIDERLEQAAQNLGASPLRAFWEVTLPLSLPGILAGSLLVFALAISAYVTPILMGGFQIMTLPILIYQQISASFNVGFATSLGMVLLVISMALVVAYNQMLALVSGQRELQ